MAWGTVVWGAGHRYEGTASRGWLVERERPLESGECFPSALGERGGGQPRTEDGQKSGCVPVLTSLVVEVPHRSAFVSSSL